MSNRIEQESFHHTAFVSIVLRQSQYEAMMKNEDETFFELKALSWMESKTENDIFYIAYPNSIEELYRITKKVAVFLLGEEIITTLKKTKEVVITELENDTDKQWFEDRFLNCFSDMNDE